MEPRQTIEWDWRRTKPLCFMDIETQSAADLRKVGGKAYLRDKSTRLLSAVFRVATRNIVWIPPGRSPRSYCPPTCVPDGETMITYVCDGIPDEVQQLARTHTWVAHNAETFDAIAWSIFYPDCRPTWIDTLHYCRLRGYPGALDAASRAMGGAGKSDSTAMKLLTSARVVGGRVVYPVGTPALWDNLVKYNIQDVLELEHIADTVFRDDVPEDELRMLELNARINTHGIQVDVELARRMKGCWEQLKADSADAIRDMTGGRLHEGNIRSVKQVKEYLASLGFVTSTLNSASVNQILNQPDKFIREFDGAETDGRLALAVLAERQSATRATVGKINRVFTVLDDDDCVRNILQYHGAGTGRFSGRDLQPHNFARGHKLKPADALAGLLNDLTYERIRTVADATRHPQLDRNLTPAEVLTTLTRSMLRARKGCKLIPIDYASIEARGIAWIARCDRALNVFADPKADIYCDMASNLFGRQVTKKDEALRHTGKIIVLGCGYGMGAPKFGVTCASLLVDLTAVGVTAEQCVKAYRTTYPEIRQVWYDLDKAAHYAVRTGGTAIAGRCRFGYSDGFLYVVLPSGRQLRYRKARIIHAPPRYDPCGPPVPQIVYTSPYGYEKTLYGGLLAENIVQAISRDILRDAMIRTQETPIVLHVHDEIVYESESARAADTLAACGRAMIAVPAWAPGFPLAAEGYTGEWYTKTPLPGETEMKFFAQV